jgi:hypothetical protein
MRHLDSALRFVTDSLLMILGTRIMHSGYGTEISMHRPGTITALRTTLLVGNEIRQREERHSASVFQIWHWDTGTLRLGTEIRPWKQLGRRVIIIITFPLLHGTTASARIRNISNYLCLLFFLSISSVLSSIDSIILLRWLRSCAIARRSLGT